MYFNVRVSIELHSELCSHKLKYLLELKQNESLVNIIYITFVFQEPFVCSRFGRYDVSSSSQSCGQVFTLMSVNSTCLSP